MSKLILILFVAVAAIAVLELRRRNKRGSGSTQADSGSYTTADESGPTETGRYRVERLMSKSQSTLRPGGSAPQKTAHHEEDEEALPDPFDDSPKE